MSRATKILALVFAVCFVLFVGTQVAKADSLSISGGLTVAPSGSDQVFSFTGVTVSAPSTDTAYNTGVTLSSATLVSATSPQFSPTSGTFSVDPLGCLTVGCMMGDINWETLAYTGTFGGVSGFQLIVGLSNISGTAGSSGVIGNFLSAGQGSGLLTLNFTATGVNSISALLANTSTINNGSFSGTFVTPEPATLGLLGVGLLGIGLIGLSRKKRSEA